MLFSLALFACKTPEAPGTNWHEHVRPVADTRCTYCHQAGGVAPFDFGDAQVVSTLGPAIVAAVEARTMPPFGYDSSCRELTHDGRLSDDEHTVFADWASGGFAIGEPSSYVPAEVVPVSPPRAPDQVLNPPAPFEPDPQRADDYLCQLVGPVSEAPTWVITAAGIPDRLDLVHHMLIYAIPPEDLQTVQELDSADPGVGFGCGGGVIDTLGAIGLGGWVPGEEVSAAAVDGEAAYLVPEGSQILLEVHYNTAAATSLEPIQDRSSVSLWMLPDGEAPDFRLHTLGVVDFELDIPAGQVVTETQRQQIAFEGLLFGSSAHMHQLGTRLDTRIIRPDGEEVCLSRIDPWDFSWQQAYSFASPETLSLGDTLEVSCTFDNTASNQPTIDGQVQAPQDVEWGDGSYDEMCIDYLVGAVPWVGDTADGLCAGFPECYAGCVSGDSNDPACLDRCLAIAGPGCAECSLEGIFGACAFETECLGVGIEVTDCWSECMNATSEVDWYGCLSSTCAVEWTDFKTCWEPKFQAGACAADVAVCGPGLRP